MRMHLRFRSCAPTPTNSRSTAICMHGCMAVLARMTWPVAVRVLYYTSSPHVDLLCGRTWTMWTPWIIRHSHVCSCGFGIVRICCCNRTMWNLSREMMLSRILGGRKSRMTPSFNIVTIRKQPIQANHDCRRTFYITHAYIPILFAMVRKLLICIHTRVIERSFSHIPSTLWEDVRYWRAL